MRDTTHARRTRRESRIGPGPATHKRHTPTDRRPPRGLRGIETTRHHTQHRRRRRCGGRRRVRRARPGFEIDHSEPPGSREAISRAGRRRPAHTAARPNKTGHVAAGNLSGQQATPDNESAKVQTHSAKTVVFGCLSPNGSALWPQQRSRPRPRRHLAGELHYASVFSACRTC